ncbi:MAG TPA: ATP-binding protein, partial [Candidatus Cloacimonadota bacterium]|nr:ATP-binding protein [Candidatus Cloacimonadota bacterium]
ASDKKGIQLEVNIAPEIDKVYCDQRRIEQVILNLLSNAVKFTEQGYVRLTCFYDNENCIISIEDSGIGMDSHEMDKLFLPFSQIDTGLSRKYEGTGLGLSICKKLIEMMNGNIRVKSELNKGSIFTVIFPYKKDSANILNGNNVKQTVTSQVSNL